MRWWALVAPCDDSNAPIAPEAVQSLHIHRLHRRRVMIRTSICIKQAESYPMRTARSNRSSLSKLSPSCFFSFSSTPRSNRPSLSTLSPSCFFNFSSTRRQSFRCVRVGWGSWCSGRGVYNIIVCILQAWIQSSHTEQNFGQFE